ncbi:MAG: hypothetical protein R3192_14965 [Woeseiaceae bacterium]|nr:hypothetical protein [Woeseiaceae bacterium]
MKKSCNSIAASTVLLFSSFVFSLSANADPENVLDSIVVTGKDFSIATSDGETFTQQFDNGAANLIDCEATSDGIVCLDGTSNIVDLSNYPGPLFTCAQAGFEAKGNRPARCSAVAVTNDGTIFVAGILNKNGSAIKECSGVFPCPTVIQDRPPIVDLDVALDGLLYVENRNTVVLLTDNSPAAPTVVTIANDRDLGLAKGKDKEQILDAAQIVDANETVLYAVTTSFGRLIAFQSALGMVSNIRQVCLAGTCNSTSPLSFDITQNAESGGPIYALVSSTGGGAGAVLVFSNDLSIGFVQDGTIATTVDSDPFNGRFLSVFEGQNINLGNCNPDCPVGNFANLSYNPLSAAATATAWEITGIPHCAWVDESVDVANTCVAEAEVADCVNGGKGVQECLCEANVLRVVGPLDGGAPTPTIAECAAAPPGLLEFNVSEVLPPNLLAQFDLLGGFPALWMPTGIQAQKIKDYFFTAILMDAGDNQSSELPELVVDDIPGSYACPGSEESPLQSSMVLRLRERAATCDAGTGVCDESIGSAITYACTSTRSRGCCSLFPLDTMLAQRPGARTAAGKWYVDGSGVTNLSDGTQIDDSAAAKFIDSHFEALEDFEYAACNDVDGDGQDPLDQTTCDQLEQRRGNAQQKLINALSNTAAGTGNCSQQSSNYQAFVSQIANYIAQAESYEGNLPACNDGVDNDGDGLVDGADGDCNNPAGDPAARVQALVAHASVLPYAVNEILLPTIPGSANCDDGWDEQDVDESGVPIWITN